MNINVRPEPIDSPVARGLIAELNVDLSRVYPPEQRFHELPTGDVAEGRGRFVVAEFGATSVVLETGDRQIAALGLYESSGYFRIPCFGAYAVSPSSVCLQKRLGPVAARLAR